jgi:lipopolysaccharide/colanic/teichoic acid biosynthesis glycosyltransferase
MCCGRFRGGIELRSHDSEYLARQSLRFDMYILLLSIAKVLRREGVSH